MDKHYNSASFTLGYEALALLGKGMYSNLWAALSELIANGIDAKPSFVKVYINMSDKTNSEIEILDNGIGMILHSGKLCMGHFAMVLQVGKFQLPQGFVYGDRNGVAQI